MTIVSDIVYKCKHMDNLTDRQQGIYRFVRESIAQRGYPPTVREIGQSFGITWPAARGHLKAIARKGFVRLVAGRSRGIELLHPPISGIPIAGVIRAGEPIAAVQELGERIGPELFSGSFALRVIGQSMRGAGILQGDYVMVDPAQEVAAGAIGVALIGDEATVKRVRYNPDGTVTLIPENAELSPITYAAGEVSIIGRVTGVVRKM